MLPKEVESILMKPLPAEALKSHPTKTFLTVINPIYVIERLNEAFGLGAHSGLLMVRLRAQTQPTGFFSPAR